MIIPNGYIRISTTTGGGFQNGKPVKATKTTSDYISANVAESRRSHGTVGEQTTATTSAYVVLVDSADAPNVSDHDKVEVFDCRKISLGEFEVQSAQMLAYVDAIKIVV